MRTALPNTALPLSRCAVDIGSTGGTGPGALGPSSGSLCTTTAGSRIWPPVSQDPNGWMVFAGAFALTLVLALMATRWLGPRGFMDHPGGRKQHEAPIPRIGGLALIISLALAGTFGLLKGTFPPLAWLALGGMACIGTLDDRFDLAARWKAGAGLAIGALLATLGTLELMHHPGATLLLGCDLSGLPMIQGALLLVLFWGMPQAFNLIDGADGLSLGYTLIALTILSIAGSPWPYLLGAVAALFVLNWPKSRLFLGDCGSLCLGLVTAMLAFKTFGKTRPEAILWLFAYPIADVFQVVIIRLATGKPLGAGDRNHLHHRLKDTLGAQAPLRVPILWVQAALCASGAILEGPWKLVSWIGLSWLFVQMAGFTCSSIRHHYQTKTTSTPRTRRPEDPHAEPRSSSI